MLQHPPAHRRVVRPRTPRANRRPTPRQRLFLGLGDLPASAPLHCEEIDPGVWVLLARHGAAWGQLVREYAHGQTTPRWVSQRMFYVYGAIPSLEADPQAYCGRWWHDEWPVDETSLVLAGQFLADLATPGQRPLLDILDPYAAGGLGTLAV